MNIQENPGHSWASNVISWGLPILLLVVLWIFIIRRIGPSSGIMSFGKSQAKFYEEDEMKVTFDDVAGIDEAKEELMEIIEFLSSPEKFTSLGGKNPERGLIGGSTRNRKNIVS